MNGTRKRPGEKVARAYPQDGKGQMPRAALIVSLREPIVASTADGS